MNRKLIILLTLILYGLHQINADNYCIESCANFQESLVELYKKNQTNSTTKCTETGLHQDTNDLECKRYYLCLLIETGMYYRQDFLCPDGEWYNPILKHCTRTYYNCTNQYDTNFYCRHVVNYTFKCSEIGRFAKINDFTCTLYYTCSQNMSDGTFTKTLDECPVGTRFDPNQQQCNGNYVCPCDYNSNSTTGTTNLLPARTQKVIGLFEESCDYSDDESFQCMDRGRFKQPNDLTCTKYYLCSLLRNGSFIQTPYTCPDGSYFDTTLQLCTSTYICPCTSSTASSTTTTTQASTTTLDPCRTDEDEAFTCTAKGRFKKPNDLTCTKYYLCSLLRNGSFIQTEYICPDGSYFDTTLHLCTTTFVCPCVITTTEGPTTTTTLDPCRTDEDEAFTCTAKGRFKKPNDLTCTKYYLCSLLRNGSFIQTEYICPDGSYFDTMLHLCTTTYVCPCVTTTTTEGPTTTMVPTTLNPCRTDEDEAFTCTAKGRFKKPNDLTCTKYYLCSLLRNGSFIQTEYICPDGSYFDTTLHLCTTTYVCPCTVTTTTEGSTTTTTMVPSTTTMVPTTTTTMVTTTLDPCRTDEDETFTCTAKGRFKKPNDLTCTKYYLCSLLRNGSFIQTPYTCPDGSYFEAALQLCTTTYVCPCTVTTTTTEVPTITTTMVPTTTTEVPTTTTTMVPTTLDPCRTDEDEAFTCTVKGRFKKPNDLTCTQYYLCSLLRNGSFIQTEYICPDGSYFDTTFHLCTTTYTCPCTISTSTTTTTTTTSGPDNFTCHKSGYFSKPSDCSEYYNCTLSKKGFYIKTLQHCPKGYNFDPLLQNCSSSYECPCDPTTTTTTTIASTTINPCRTDEDDVFTCTSDGRFRKPNDLSCKKYYHCSLLRNGTFIQSEYKCPSGSYFDPFKAICSVSYMCPCIVTTTTPTTYLTTVDPCRTDEDEAFTCSTKGRFKKPNDLTCKKYYLCSLLRNGSFIQTEYSCPDGSYFDRTLHMCTTTFVCPCTTSTTTEVPTTTMVSTTLNPCRTDEDEAFTCTAKGRFKKPNDLTCTKYYLCSLLRNGSLIQTPYTCPDGSYFDAAFQLCTTTYVCPCTVTTMTTEVPTITTTMVPTTTTMMSTTTTTLDPCRTDEDEAFTCTAKGRFKKPNDLTCTKYYLCSLLRNGTFIQTEYSCPDGSYFDTTQHMCTVTYICPCTISTSSSTTTTTQATTTTENPCRTDEDDAFSCATKGRFKKPNDLTCTKYYLCSLLRNGSFIQTEYICPDGSYFDTTLHLCTTTYVCPCTTTTPTTTTTTTRATTEVHTTLDPCRTDEDEAFTCTAKGRFKKPNDLTCTEYYLCSLLRNGSFIQTRYTCPDGSYFEAALQLCTTTYVCPCTVTTMTTEGPTITTTTKVPTTTTTKVPTTLDPCRTDEDEAFTCTAKGRFKKPNDLTCTEYYLCSLLRNGSFIQTRYTCPDGSYFEAALQLCTTTYVCPCTVTTMTTEVPTITTTMVPTTTTKVPTTTTTKVPTTLDPCRTDEDEAFTCTSKGRFKKPNDLTCTKYYLCSLLRNGSFIQTPYTCPDGSYFEAALQLCTTTYVCPCTVTTITEAPTTTTTMVPTTTTEVPTTTTTMITTTVDPCRTDEDEAFTCTTKGRFKKPNDLTCTKYYLCSLLRNGSLIQTEYTCPDGSFFDTTFQLCTTTYTCPCTISTPTTTPTSVPTTTFDPCRTDEDDAFICSVKGRFRKPNDLSCTKYYLCSLLRNGSFIQTEYTCPESAYFDPSLHMCTATYTCPCGTTSITTAPITTRTCDFTTKNSTFTCTTKGRFAKLDDLTCTKYYACTLLKSGDFVRTEYICPDGSFFDPQLNICTVYYTCPCTVADPDFPYMLPIVVNKGEVEETEDSSSSAYSNGVSTKCKTYKNVKFVCTRNGRYSKPNDLTCKRYYYCEFMDDGFRKIEYSCPSGTRFDPSLQMCNRKYSCPCDQQDFQQSLSNFIKSELFPFWVLL